MITHPTVLKYDVDADRLVELYRQRRAAISEHRDAPRRRTVRFPALWPRRRGFAGRSSGAASIPPTTVLPERG